MTLPGASAPAPPEPVRPSSVAPVLDVGLRVIGGLVAVTAAVLTALVEVFFSVLRADGRPLGASVVLAVVANLTLAWFAGRTVGRNWAVALPALAWFAVMVLASRRTAEGDLLLLGDTWVGVVTIFAGSIAFAVVAFRLILAGGAQRPTR